MRKNSVILLFALLLPISFSNSSCNKECTLALADLITSLAVSGFTTVTVGVPFNIASVIANVPNTIIKCAAGEIAETLTAGNSQSRIIANYDENGDGTFVKNVLDSNFEVPQIPSGMEATEDYQTLFQEPGDYRLITIADDKDDVEERDETNNASDPQGIEAGRGTAHSSGTPLIIRVLPNPNFTREKGEPYVKILSRTVSVQ